MSIGTILGVVIAALLLSAAHAQRNHAVGHDWYQDWSSQKTGNCCNNQDCGELRSGDWRQSGATIEVAIAGKWCPVKREHLLIKGRSPDGSLPHACISHHTNSPDPCDRLLCFSDLTRS